jgi:hypothetical protein
MFKNEESKYFKIIKNAKNNLIKFKKTFYYNEYLENTNTIINLNKKELIMNYISLYEDVFQRNLLINKGLIHPAMVHIIESNKIYTNVAILHITTKSNGIIIKNYKSVKPFI